MPILKCGVKPRSPNTGVKWMCWLFKFKLLWRNIQHFVKQCFFFFELSNMQRPAERKDDEHGEDRDAIMTKKVKLEPCQ